MKNNTIALIDSKLSIRLSYKKMREEERALAENLEKRVLVLELCTNSLGAILGYKSFLDYNLVTLLLDARTKKEILYVFIKKYDPYYIWLPDFYGKIEGFNTIVYQKYGYYLLKSDECKGHELFNNLAVLLTTSGTTGSSQVVRLSYQNLYNNAEMIAKYMNLNYADKAITTMPLSYSYGLSIINSHFFVGASIVESVLIKDISMVKRIKDIFLKEGYTSMIVSDLPHSYFSGVDYVKEGIINENLLIYYELYYSLDLIFVFSKKSNGYNFDIKIVATEKEIKVSSYRKNISWKREGVLLDSRNIYQIIKRIFA